MGAGSFLLVVKSPSPPAQQCFHGKKIPDKLFHFVDTATAANSNSIVTSLFRGHRKFIFEEKERIERGKNR